MKNKDMKRRTMWVGGELWSAVKDAAAHEDRTIASWIRAALTAALKDSDIDFTKR